MGKNLKGKECGKGICQRKDGLYFARFYAKNGARQNGYFKTLPEAKKWLADAKYEDTHNLIVTAPDMTVDKWFNYWIDNIICDLAPNTIRNYRERYEKNIQPLIGTMCIADVKPMHCKAVLNRMETEYAGSTIRQTYISMGTMFKSAVMNDIIAKHPMNGVRYTKPVRAVDDIKYLTVEEQEKFLEAAERSHNYRQYALLLETGLRTAKFLSAATVASLVISNAPGTSIATLPLFPRYTKSVCGLFTLFHCGLITSVAVFVVFCLSLIHISEPTRRS